jgi:hypothetical protein
MPEKPEHELAIDAAVHAGDLDVVIETAPFYRLSPTAARVIVEEVRDALATWPAVARSAHLGPDETDTIREAIDR